MGDRDLPDLGRPRRVHLIGVGGSGMGPIALVLVGMGHEVSGSDAVASRALDALAEHGVTVHAGHRASNVGQAEIVAASTAIPSGNVEVAEAARRGLRVWRRAEVLAAACALRRTVAVAGSHGKTTTSAMLALVLRHAGLRPSMVVGGDIVGVGIGGAWDPGGEWLVVEADESDGTFLELGAEAVIVTSVEPDHLDYYGDEDALRDAFSAFVGNAIGPKVLCADEPGAASLRSAAVGDVVGYGRSPEADARIDAEERTRWGTRFRLVASGETVGPFTVAVPGQHNTTNAAVALTMAHALGVPWTAAAQGLEQFHGTRRRFERRGEAAGVTFVDDYAHLPSEVSATLVAARSGGWARVVAVFQPHRYTRTAALWSAFGTSFAGADVVVVTDVYPAGEAPVPGVTGLLIADAVRACDPSADVRYAPTLADAEEFLRVILRSGDLCLTLGAGDLTNLPDRFVPTREQGT